MSDTIIRAVGIGKKYRIGHQAGGERYVSLRESLTLKARNLQHAVGDILRGRSLIARDKVEDYWALRDVSFEVKRGEVMGIVGRNGAGKSTLLKILSRITEPTEGRATVRGRIASLLEVGTGFHPELTGRENIFLNGAILGLSRREIRQRFDEIVAFAEIDRFLDTPVKRYSSGMYVRLAFAVAAHLEPDILVVDEVLSVGDTGFQEKCIGKMKEVSLQGGRTVLFVTHNLAAVRSLCKTGMLLEGGRISYRGTSQEVVDRYISGGEMGRHNGVIPDDLARLYATGEAKLRRVRLTEAGDDSVQSLVTGKPLRIAVDWEVFEPLSAMIEIGILDFEGRQITQSLSSEKAGPLRMERGVHAIELRIENVLFPGRYSILLGIHKPDGTTVDWVERALDFEVINAGKNERDYYPWTVRGYLRPHQHWSAPSTQASAQ